jgi:hypothetical protein
VPGIVLGVGLFLAYTRGPVVLYGTLWILFLAYLTIELPAPTSSFNRHSGASIPSWRRRDVFSAPAACEFCATSWRRS